MRHNVGTVDRTLRLGASAVLFVLALVVAGLDSALGIVCLVFGLTLLVTGLARSCPVWSVAKIDTRGADEKRPAA